MYFQTFTILQQIRRLLRQDYCVSCQQASWLSPSLLRQRQTFCVDTRLDHTQCCHCCVTPLLGVGGGWGCMTTCETWRHITSSQLWRSTLRSWAQHLRAETRLKITCFPCGGQQTNEHHCFVFVIWKTTSRETNYVITQNGFNIDDQSTIKIAPQLHHNVWKSFKQNGSIKFSGTKKQPKKNRFFP